ncbi:hypothetical protein HMPREF9141_0409 [Prevotella multiformis DSM 16608]|uniref:Uncharacterized protein n=1 Tax=Prevotella multiformis DSM 16608 TaxID=888743 RepID=F0F493_9BACT|nr:hypothetical protein HMPREF9141_0409 [Prevotella multiformis DSM 16608]
MTSVCTGSPRPDGIRKGTAVPDITYRKEKQRNHPHFRSEKQLNERKKLLNESKYVNYVN